MTVFFFGHGAYHPAIDDRFPAKERQLPGPLNAAWRTGKGAGIDLITFSLMIGTFQLLFGIPILLYPDRCERWLASAYKEDVLIRSMGYLWLVAAVMVLLENSRVGTDVEGLVRLGAWATAIKCLMLCWWPQQLMRMREKIYGSRVNRALGIAVCSVGALFIAAAIHLKDAP
ncbi:MAG: hypothetical protein AAEJ46_09145 [Planctomycetota bacterium]